jgi:PAS domain S-box-containing protein
MKESSISREKALLEEIERLRSRLAEPEDTIAAIRSGQVDAFVVTEEVGERVYLLKDAAPPYRLMVEEMKEGAATLDSRQTVLYANRRLAEVLGRAPESLRGTSFREFVSPESLSDLQSLLGGAGCGRGEIELRREGGMTFPAQVSVTAFEAEQLSAFCVVITDLTEQKMQTAATAAEEAWRDADRRKNEFLAMLGHELRNPLAAIAHSAQILDQLDPSPEIAQAGGVIRRQIQHVGRIVDELLDVSRIATGKIEIRREAVDFGALVGSVVDGYRPRLERRRLTLTLSVPSDPIAVHGDPTRLTQVVANLLDNAVKFSDENGEITVDLSRQGDRVRLTVRDRGIGIPPEILPRIFELFTQGDSSRTRPRAGLGIGLALVRRFVELQDGTVQARSAGPGLGSEFEVSLPCLLRSQLEPVDASLRHFAQSPQRLLIVDDYVDSANALAALLELEGHRVKVTYDGPSALACALEFDPETILLDIGLPGMDGYDVARRLRQKLGDEVLIIALTGYGQDEDRRRSEEAGIDHHVLKPVKLDVIARLLNGRPGAAEARKKEKLRNES